MTEKEAIEIIEYASAFNSDNSPLTKALDMAIKALEKQSAYEQVAWESEKHDKTRPLGLLTTPDGLDGNIRVYTDNMEFVEDKYLVTGVEDGWLKVDKEIFEKYLQAKARLSK